MSLGIDAGSLRVNTQLSFPKSSSMMTESDATYHKRDDLRLAIDSYRREIAQAERQLELLRHKLAIAEEEEQQCLQPLDPDALSHKNQSNTFSVHDSKTVAKSDRSQRWALENEEYKRYGRQLILEKVGLQGQLNLKEASVLIVGLGGLGCPAAAYLAGAGVGTIGLLDGDVVDISNLHRQIIHNTSTVGDYKVHSAADYLQNLNPLPKYRTYPEFITANNATRLFEQYDLILDCTDHPATRYLISDAAVISRKPLISASALGVEGQLLVLNDALQMEKRERGKYCYRCVFPKPPPADTVLSCGEGGIFGPVVGVMGVLMATAALKLLVRGKSNPPVVSDMAFGATHQPSMLLYSAFSDPMFRSVRIKGRRDDCPSCSSNATITAESLVTGSLDYAAFCGRKNSTAILGHTQRINPSEYILLINRLPPSQRKDIVVIDVRPKVEYDLGHIMDSINWPIQEISKEFHREDKTLERHSAPQTSLLYLGEKWDKVSIPPNTRCAFTICRHGNDSQVAAELLKGQRTNFNFVVDIKGGLEAWRKEVDPTFPDY
ncbi:MAG: hypothetical protein Q9213_006254 [Squamulea squamosa]